LRERAGKGQPAEDAQYGTHTKRMALLDGRAGREGEKRGGEIRRPVLRGNEKRERESAVRRWCGSSMWHQAAGLPAAGAGAG
jgi:hypothetical protein